MTRRRAKVKAVRRNSYFVLFRERADSSRSFGKERSFGSSAGTIALHFAVRDPADFIPASFVAIAYVLWYKIIRFRNVAMDRAARLRLRGGRNDLATSFFLLSPGREDYR